LYATDASVYRQLPLAVAFPKSEQDIQQLVRFADREGWSLIPRAAGTSLAGQCVGEGIVVDVSKYMTNVLEFSPEEKWIKVQPGIIRDELNTFLHPYGLFFGPNTSTSNRCMIGGMVGNNSCGSSSIVYGSTRDHVLELDVIISNGDRAVFKNRDTSELQQHQKGSRLEDRIYQQLIQELQADSIQQQIREAFPRPEIHRRNTGYAIDLLIEQQPFKQEGPPLNLCTLLAGSEGTLAFTTAVKLHLDPLPEPHEVVLAAHFSSVRAALLATVIAMRTQPSVCELMDRFILDATKNNRRQRQNRFFVEGDPAAILCVEFRGNSAEAAKAKAEQLIQQLKEQQLGTAFPFVFPPQTKRVWELRKAGLGVLFNQPGDQKPVACIEDTAVRVEDLPEYIDAFEQILRDNDQKAVFYAHAGAGELHLRPYLNLKDPADRAAFRTISTETAKLVKKYQGSLSGEHGDGRVRAEFLPLMIGEANYELLRRIKQIWDPKRYFQSRKNRRCSAYG
jgi:FAD/FMN-containing dehydrogenase